MLETLESRHAALGRPRSAHQRRCRHAHRRIRQLRQLKSNIHDRWSGYDIYGNSDAFHYVYQPLTGNGWVTVQVTSDTAPTQTAPWRA